MKIEVSNGEILDKFSILEIKMEKIEDWVKLENIRREFETLSPKVSRIYSRSKNLDILESLYEDLYNVNLTLWNIEDQIRECEREGRFGADFIELARSVYYMNDERAHIKKMINYHTGSQLVEEKSYQQY